MALKRVFSSDPRFKGISFSPGLNIVVACKTDKSTSRNTRNGSGKSSLVEIISYVLGSNVDEDDIFKLDVFAETYFSLRLDIGDREVTASRCANQTRIYLEGANDISTDIKTDDETGRSYLALGKWKEVLGNYFFDLDNEVAGSHRTNRPSMRSLFSYFVRKQGDGGFADAEKHFKNQNIWDYQVNLSYLFDLDWRISQDWQQVRDTEKSIDALRKALKAGALGGDVIDSASKLRTQLTVQEKGLDELRSRRESFRVADDYRELEQRASALTQTINKLADENTIDELLIRDLRESLAAEVPPPRIDIERLYKATGVELPGLVVERFDQVTKFHESVIQNRRSFLNSEIEAAEVRISERRSAQKLIDVDLSEIMSVLQSSGALEQFSALQDELSRVSARVELLKEKYELARQLESRKTDLDINRGKLLSRLQHDLDDREETIKRAILTFEAISEKLYEDPGSLTIEPTDNGPEFGTIIHAKKSKGKNNMQIFCFDMTLAILNAKRHRMPGFLIHDSHLFDGADERQIARALKIGADAASEHGFQYIVTMNTDDLPRKEELPDDFDLDSYINPVTLTDASDNGGLFGFRFG